MATQAVVPLSPQPRIYLEPISADDETHLAGAHELYSDESFMAWTGRPPHKTIFETRDKLLERSNHPSRPWISNHAILLRPTPTSTSSTSPSQPQIVGLIGTFRLTPATTSTPEAPELGYGIHSSFQGRGYATEALRVFLDLYWSLEESRDVPQILALVDEGNEASLNVLRKVGARRGEVYHGLGGEEGGDKKDIVGWVLEKPGAGS